jgi:preprotein translocase subunit SecA
MLKSLFTNNTLTNKYQSLINQINSLETNLKTLTDSELRAKTFYLKKKISNRKKFRHNIVGRIICFST